MNDKIFELQQELIETQDSFKNAILSEPDAEKHADIIAKFSKDEQNLSEKIAEEIEKLSVVESNLEVIEEKEDAENTNNNHPLVNTFEKMYKEGAILETIAKQFREGELIEIGKEFELEFTSAGTKLDKVKLIIEKIKIKK